ncbi:MORN repeat-containing protein 4-like [Pomacea canaliculata]|nr:MORN repeat-containing protein 4-like [Pomacea canaliculata]XP_025093969.1 MORN repeat-containing protein 4-like [Pomacea canaliculata]
MDLQIEEYKYHDGTVYNGQWNEHGHRHGIGYLAFPDTSKYWGQFEDGMFGGLGILTFQDGSRYEGEFKKGKFHGLGIFTRKDKMAFEGEFREGKIWGLGLVTFPDGSHGLPRNEGYFEGNHIIRREKCAMVVHQARITANRAKKIAA